ncbi:MAG: alanine racemase [Rhodospirillales bacterium]|jgi:alanine racemase|nr:alanine racemase [Rhodospirillales bacterium]
MPDAATAGAILTIDLQALASNYGLIRAQARGAECAASIKADAYGLGVERVAETLAEAGCRTFFVAQLDEGTALRRQLPSAEIHVLNGVPPGTERLFAEHRLIPVLNSLGDIATWAEFGRANGARFAADVHVDTGMSRLGLPADEIEAVSADPGQLADIEVALVMSHLACADEPDHPLNRRQLEAFRAARAALPMGRASLANSSGVFLGSDYHFDMVRAGAALYGIAPVPDQLNAMAQVVRLQGRILQVRLVDSSQTVGYGASHRVTRRTQIATVAVGYGDGFPRSAGNSAVAVLGDVRVPIVGRVSMDLLTIDVSDAPGAMARVGALVDLIGPHNPLDEVARDACTIGYEVLTRLGPRYHRVYLGRGRDKA